MPKLRPWYQVVTPREDLRENRPLDASEFAVNLAHIADSRATVAKDYLEPARFFERTLVTESLGRLASQAAAGSMASPSRPRPSSTWRRNSAAGKPIPLRRSITWPATRRKHRRFRGSVPF